MGAIVIRTRYGEGTKSAEVATSEPNIFSPEANSNNTGNWALYLHYRWMSDQRDRNITTGLFGLTGSMKL